MKKEGINNFSVFFSRCPALLFSLFFMLGLAFSTRPRPSLLIPLFFICLPWVKRPLKLLPLFSFFFLAFFYGHLTKEQFPNNIEKIQGTAHFSPSNIKAQKSHFKTSYILKGVIQVLDDPLQGKAKNIPCSIPLLNSPNLLSTKDYLIQGVLEKKEERFLFTPDLKTPWVEIKNSFSLTKWRFQLKKFLSNKIQKIYSAPLVSDFLTALMLGDLNNQFLRFTFNRLGLQHILAISGFHFGLLALFIGGFLRFFFKEKTATIALMGALTIYFLLIGYSPSILRAYLAITLYLLSRLGNRRAYPLNILGCTLLLELLFKPESLRNLGFQLSFLATGSILILFPTTFSWMEKIFPYRSINESLAFKSLDKWVYLFCSFLRSTFALNLAVHLIVIPVCLFYFGKFPLISCLYNLFIPLTISLSLFLLLFSTPFYIFFPPLACLLSSINESFTSRVLRLITEAPNRLDFYLTAKTLPEPLLLLLLILTFSTPLLIQTFLTPSKKWIV